MMECPMQLPFDVNTGGNRDKWEWERLATKKKKNKIRMKATKKEFVSTTVYRYNVECVTSANVNPYVRKHTVLKLE